MEFTKSILKFDYSRPLVFLCGCYYNEKDERDRRSILKTFISKSWYKKEAGIHATPLIVDQILKNSDVKKHNLKINLLEEILASISYKTYIFLDTMSTAYELGQFSNFYAANNVTIFVDKQYRERINCSVGEYICKSFENEMIEYTAEYDAKGRIYFGGNKIPEEIDKKLLLDTPLASGYKKISNKIVFVTDQSKIKEDATFSYSFIGNDLQFTCSLKTFFYFASASIGRDLDSNIKSINNIKFQKICSGIKADILNSFILHSNSDNAKKALINDFNISINVGILNFEELVLHIYYLLRQFKIKKDRVGDNEYIFSKNQWSFQFTDSVSNSLFKNCQKLWERELDLKESNFPVIKKQLTINKKSRTIVAYSNNYDGKKFKQLHQAITNNALSYVESSSLSFAYKRNTSIKDCISKHIGNIHFVKLDISKYFESIRYKNFIKIYNDELKNKILSKVKMPIGFSSNMFYFANSLIGHCFYKYRLPIGFSSSPKISDIYLLSLDRKFENNKKVIYTRYADDILISSNDQKSLNKAYLVILKELKLKNLKLNNKKTIRKSLIHLNDSIKFLGINIVNRGSGFSLTISNKYLKQLVYDIKKYKSGNQVEKIKLIGKVDFVKYTCFESYNKLRKMLFRGNLIYNDLIHYIKYNK